jgi:hypothetical protein
MEDRFVSTHRAFAPKSQFMNFGKKNITHYFLGTLLLLGLLALWLMWRKSDTQKSSFQSVEMQFAQNTDELYKIFIAQRDGETTTLERQGDNWIYNQKYKANLNVMEPLLRTIRGVRVQYIPTRASVPSIVNELASIGTKVELYAKNGKLLKVYYVGGATNDEYGTHMIMDGADQPYVTHLPELEGSIRWRYMLRGDQWRDKTILAEMPSKIVSVEVDYPKQKNKSFKINKLDGQYQVEPMYSTTSKSRVELNKVRVESYLVGMESVIAEGFENNSTKRDSVLAQVPFSVLKVKNETGQERTLRFFPIYYQNFDPLTDKPTPVERYFVEVNGQDFMLVQQILVGKLFWSYDSFYQ